MITSNINECPYFISGIGESYMDNVRNFIIIIEKEPVINLDSIFKCLSKKFIVINEKSLIKDSFNNLFNKAVYHLKNGIPKPVILKIDYKILETKLINDKVIKNYSNIDYSISNKILKSIITDINNSSNFILYIGNGCIDCENEINKFVNKTNCLVSSTFSGKGIFSEKKNNWFWCGISCGIPEKLYKILEKIELLIIVGAKMGELSTGHFRTRPFKKVYYIDIDENNFNSNYDAINLKCDSKIFFDIINKQNLKYKNNFINENINAHYEIINYEKSYKSKTITPFKLVNYIQKIFPDNTIYSCDSGNSILLSIESLRLSKSKCFIGPIDYSSMGYGIPSILGASLDNRYSIVFEGDGSFLMTGLEIFISKNINKKILIIILRDNELGMMSSIQRSINKKTNCTILPDYNLNNICNSFNIPYYKICNENELFKIDEIFKLVSKNKLVLIECIIDYNKPFYFTKGISKSKIINSKLLKKNNEIINCSITNDLIVSNDNYNLFYNILNKNNNLFSNKIAIIDVFYNKYINYNELKKLTIKSSYFIQNNLKENLIGVLLFNSYHINILHFSIAITNKTLLNLNTNLKPDELKYILNDTKLKYLYTSIHFKKILLKILPDTFLEKIIWIDSNENICKNILFYDFEKIINKQLYNNKLIIMKNNSENYFQMYYTSGTTGKPKGVLLTYDNVIKHMLGIIIEMKINQSDKWLHISPMFHLVDAFSIYSLPYVSATQVIQNKFNINETIKLLSNFEITITNMASTIGKLLIQSELIKKYKYNLRILSCGGAPLDNLSIKKIKQIFNCEFFISYGMTECCGKISMSILNQNNKNNFEYICTSGKPFDMTEIMIIDDYGNEIIENDIIGNILIRGECLFKGYYKKNNQNTFDNKGWFDTGDLGKWFNGYLKVVDRKKDMILVGSENVYCIEVEETLNSYKGIKSSAVIGIEHKLLGQVPVAFLVLEKNFILDNDNLKKFCKKKLSNYKIPTQFIIYQKLPFTGSGKINKSILKENINFNNMIFNDYANLTKMIYNHYQSDNIYNIHFNIVSNIVDKSMINDNLIYYTDNNNQIKNFFTFLQLLIQNNFKHKLIVIVQNNPVSEALIGLFRVFKNEFKSNSVIIKTNKNIIKNIHNIKKFIDFNKNDYEFFYDGEIKKLDITKFNDFSDFNFSIQKQHQDEFILITGGTGAIGKMLISYLIKNNFFNIYVLTRNNNNPNNQSVNYIYIDSLSKESICKELNKIFIKFKKCKYFFHLAGALNNNNIINLNWSDFDTILQPKINYLNYILEIFDYNNYEIYKTILFSSVFSILGYSKLSHYATANSYLNGIANSRKNTISISWGTFDKDGMAFRLGNEFKKYWINQGMQFILPDNSFNLIFYLIYKNFSGNINYFPINFNKFFSQNNCITSFHNIIKNNNINKPNTNKIYNILKKYIDITKTNLTLNELGIDSYTSIIIQNELSENNVIIDDIFNLKIKNIINDIDKVDEIINIDKGGEFNDVNKIDEFNDVVEIDEFNDVNKIDEFNDVVEIDEFNDVVEIDEFNKVEIGENTKIICEKIGNNIKIGNNCKIEIKNIPNNFKVGDNTTIIQKF